MKKALRWLLRKILRLILLLLCACVLTFGLVSLSPIDPLQANLGQAALGSMTEAQIEALQAYWGVDQPLPDRFLAWAQDFLRGDMGISLRYRQPVSDVIGARLGQSIGLLFFAWIFSGLLGLTLGLTAGMWQDRWPDRLIRGYSLLIASTPTFWLAILVLLIFSVWWPVLPIGFSLPIGADAASVSLADRLRHVALPALVLSMTGFSSIALHTRDKCVEILHSDYVLLATARGESRGRIALSHVLRNALLPAMTLQFASIGEIIGGSVLVEQVFSYPGLGQAAIAAGLGADVPLLLGITVVCSALVFTGNLVADLLAHLVDPRLRKGAWAK